MEKNMSNKEYINYSICKNHTGKMYGIQSISTSCACNRFCAMRAQEKTSICSHCYAQAQLKRYKTLSAKLESNYEFYNNVVLTESDIPFINQSVFRFESFGDLESVTQFANYCMIAKCNANTRFTLWTKNLFIVNAYLDNKGKIPRNLYIIVSSPVINKVYDVSNISERLKKHVSAVFTVYDKKFAADNDIEINCGGRKCIECMRCYSLNHDRTVYINELLK